MPTDADREREILDELRREYLAEREAEKEAPAEAPPVKLNPQQPRRIWLGADGAMRSEPIVHPDDVGWVDGNFRWHPSKNEAESIRQQDQLAQQRLEEREAEREARTRAQDERERRDPLRPPAGWARQ